MTRKEYLNKINSIREEEMKSWNKLIDLWEQDELLHDMLTEKDIDILGLFSSMFEVFIAQEAIYTEEKDEIRAEELRNLFWDAYIWSTGEAI